MLGSNCVFSCTCITHKKKIWQLLQVFFKKAMFASIAVPGGNISTEKLDGKQVQNKSTAYTTSFSMLIYLIFLVDHRKC